MARRCFASEESPLSQAASLFDLWSPMGYRIGASQHPGRHTPEHLVFLPNTHCYLEAQRGFLPSMLAPPGHKTSCRRSGWTGKGKGSCSNFGAAELLAIHHFLAHQGHIHPKVNPKHPLYLRKGHTLTLLGAEHRLGPVTSHPSRKWQLQESWPKRLTTKHATQQRRSDTFSVILPGGYPELCFASSEQAVSFFQAGEGRPALILLSK